MQAAPRSLHRSTSHHSSSAIAAHEFPPQLMLPALILLLLQFLPRPSLLAGRAAGERALGRGSGPPWCPPQEKREGSRASQPCWRCFLVVPVPEVRGHTAISWGSARSRPRLRWPEKHRPGKKGFPWDGSAKQPSSLADRTSSCELS